MIARQGDRAWSLLNEAITYAKAANKHLPVRASGINERQTETILKAIEMLKTVQEEM